MVFYPLVAQVLVVVVVFDVYRYILTRALL